MTDQGTQKPAVRRKSFTYRTGITWVGQRAGISHSGDKIPFRVASPPEFKGEAGVWTPEDLFVAALNSCQLMTFVSFAIKLGLPVASYESEAEGLLEFVDDGFRFTKVVLKPRVVVSDPEAVEAVRKALDDAHRACLVARSVLCEVVLESTVEVAER
ncbi:MAG: OsmC family protein [Thermoanaerobaculia bacterium]|jgi:organic hydroperoxide reductase OsmC/OhrA